MQPAATQSAENKQSRLLNYEENLQLFKILGSNCQSLATCVIQLYETQGPRHDEWKHKDAGVLCFIKDNSRKNYFFRIYCLQRCKMIWEHELYNNMDYKQVTSYLHSFEGEKCIICFNFANEDEATDLRRLVKNKLMVKQRREAKRAQSTNNALNNRSNTNDVTPVANIDNSSSKQKRRKTINKADISLPLDFRHVSHVGWDPHKGFDVDTQDTALTQLFAKAGVSEMQLKDKGTREFIYDFISRNDTQNIIQDEQVKKARRPPPAVPPPPSVQQPPPPAPPSLTTAGTGPPVPPRSIGRQTSHSRVAPPPPPSVTQATSATPHHNNVPPPRPPTTPKVASLKSPPPPPNNAPAPPPPPMPMPAPVDVSPPPAPIPNLSALSEQPAVQTDRRPDGRNALLDSIRSGISLRPVEKEVDKRVVEDARGDLLSEIRKGFHLKPATEREVKPISPSAEQHNNVNDLAAALSRALADRNRVIHPDEDSDSSDSNDDDWDD